jgi:hypothetical protein
MGVRVYVFHLSGPGNACEAARVVVAADRAAEAARAVRSAGWHGVHHRDARVSSDSDEQATGLSEPGAVWWYPWAQRPPRDWRRVGGTAA